MYPFTDIVKFIKKKMSFNTYPFFSDFNSNICSPCNKICKCKSRSRGQIGDPRLNNYQKWMERRKVIQMKLARATQRDVSELLINDANDWKTFSEEKQLVYQSKIPQIFDKYRGNPAFWKMPLSLKPLPVQIISNWNQIDELPAQICEGEETSDYYYTICGSCGSSQYYDDEQCQYYDGEVYEGAEYFSVMTKEQQNAVVDIERVGVPQLIHLEKNSVSSRSAYWRKSKYLKRRLEEIETKHELKPHRPVFDDLIIIGTQISSSKSEQKIPKKSHISINASSTSQTTISEKTIPNSEEINNNILIKLNDIEIPAQATGRKIIRICKEYDTGSQKIETVFLALENRSNVCLRFILRQIKTDKIFKDLIKDEFIQNQVCFFNRNEYLIEPDYKINIPFWIKTRISGFFTQHILLHFSPDLWQSQLEIIVLLKVNGIQKNFNTRCITLQQELESKANGRLIKEILQEVLPKKVDQFQNNEVAVFTYDRATIFESVNSIFDPLHFRPCYVYDKAVVDDLEIFYNTIKLENHNDIWDSKLDTLRSIVKQRELSNNHKQLEILMEEILKKLDMAQSARKQREEMIANIWKAKFKTGQNPIVDNKNKKKIGSLNTPSSEQSVKENVSKTLKKASSANTKSKSSSKQTESSHVTIAKHVIQKPATLSEILENLISKLKRPSTWVLNQKDKLNFVYTLLCAYMDKITDEVEDLRTKLSITSPKLKVESEITEHYSMERVYDEKFDDSKMESGRFFRKVGKLEDKRAPDWTTQISLLDYKQRFQAFHKDNASAKSKTITTNTKSHLKLENTPKINSSAINRNFSKISYETQVIISDQLSRNELKLYQRNLYLIFYTNLSKTIDDLIAVFEMLPHQEMPHQIVERIRNKYVGKPASNTSLYVRVFDLKRTIRELLIHKDEDLEEISKTKSCEEIIPIFNDSQQSMWSILEGYKKKTKVFIPQTDDDNIYTIYAKTFKPTMCDMSTSITPEEVIHDRIIQTDSCGDKTDDSLISLSGDYLDQGDDKVDMHADICQCEETKFTLYNSDTSFNYKFSENSSDNCQRENLM